MTKKQLPEDVMYSLIHAYIYKFFFLNDSKTDITINITQIAFKDGNYGEEIIGKKNDMDYFSKIELEVLSSVLEQFKGSTTKEVVDISHEEPAWIENEPARELIS